MGVIMRALYLFGMCLIGFAAVVNQCDLNVQAKQAESVVESIQPLSVTVNVVELEFAEQTVKNVAFEYLGESVSTEQQIIDQTIIIRQVGEVQVDSAAKFINVVARKSLFEVADVVHAGGNYLVIGEPGKYLVEVDTFDPELGIERISKVLVIPGDSGGEPDTPPDDPASKFGELAKLAVQLSIQMDDEPTRQAIVASLGKSLPLINAEGITHNQAVDIVQSELTDAMRKRTGLSLKKDWNAGMFQPIATKFRAIVENKDDFISAWEAIYNALGDVEVKSTQVFTTDPAINVIQTNSDCYWNGQRWVCPNNRW